MRVQFIEPASHIPGNLHGAAVIPEGDRTFDETRVKLTLAGALRPTNGALIVGCLQEAAAAPRSRRRGLEMIDRELTPGERAALTAQVERLREEHRDLDAAIEALRDAGQADQLQLQRLKKRKLLLRDKLSQLEDQLTPDIIA